MSKIEQTRTTRSSHRTRGASKRAHCVASQELSAAIIGIVDADFELNLTNYSEAMCSDNRDGSTKVMEENRAT